MLMIGNHPSVKGGITSVITQIMEHDWKEKNIEISFIPTYIGNGKIRGGVYFAKSCFRIITKIIVWRPDVVHIHMSYKGSFWRKYVVHRVCKLFNVKDIIHMHGSEFEMFYKGSSDKVKKIVTSLFKECKGIIVLGEKWSKFIKTIAPDANIVTINNTIAIPEIKINQDTEEISILFLGVLVKRKGVIDLLEAINKLQENGVLNKRVVVFKIAGVGNQELILKKYVKDNNLDKYVKFLGWIEKEEKKIQLQSNNILVLPSYNEGLPISILEGISYGMPIVSTNVGSVAEAVKNEINGYLIKPGDIQAIYNSLKKLILEDSLRVKMGKESRDLAEKVFDERNYFILIEECYKKY